MKPLQHKVIIKSILEENLKQIKELAIIEGLASIHIQELIDLSYLFQFNDIYEETRKVITQAIFGNPQKGDLRNFPNLTQNEIIEHGEKDKQRLLKEPNIVELESKYPIYDITLFLKIFSNFTDEVEGLNAAFRGDYDKAIQQCYHPEYGWNEQNLEFIISYLFINQEFEIGLKYKKQYVTKEHSIQFLDIVEFFERSKTHHWNIIETTFNQLYRNQERTHGDLMYAKGLAGLEPYGFYPWNEEWEFY